jgi:hypothetical protein
LTSALHVIQEFLESINTSAAYQYCAHQGTPGRDGGGGVGWTGGPFKPDLGLSGALQIDHLGEQDRD